MATQARAIDLQIEQTIELICDANCSRQPGGLVANSGNGARQEAKSGKAPCRCKGLGNLVSRFEKTGQIGRSYGVLGDAVYGKQCFEFVDVLGFLLANGNDDFAVR